MSRLCSQAEGNLNPLARVDDYFASILDCDARALRASGWTEIISHSEDDIARKFFGMRQVVYLLAPLREGSQRARPAGVVSLASELREPVGTFLFHKQPQEFFRPDVLMKLDQVVRASVTQPLAPGSEPRLGVYYATGQSYQPYTGPWLEWIERLDESTEKDPYALALLAQHGGGVFAVRYRGSIIAFVGLRAYSSLVWELTSPRLTASRHSAFVARPGELFAALIARATYAAMDAGRIPICTLTPRETKLRRALLAAGYCYYADASVYATTTP